MHKIDKRYFQFFFNRYKSGSVCKLEKKVISKDILIPVLVSKVKDDPSIVWEW